MKQLLVTVLLTCLLLTNSWAQKKAVTIDDFKNWNSLSNYKLSNNGEYVIYEQNPGHGDGILILKHIDSGKETQFPRGYKAQFSDKSDLLVFQIKTPLDTLRKATVAKVKKDKMPKDSLGVYSLETRILKKFAKSSAYKMPKKGESWMAFTSEYFAKKDSIDKKDQKKYLIIVHNTNIDTLTVPFVKEFTISSEGTTLAALVDPTDSTKMKQVVRIDITSGEKTIILEDSTSIKSVTLDPSGQQLALLQSKDTTKTKNYSLLYANKNDLITEIVDSLSSEIPSGWGPAENSKLHFSKSGERLFFDTAPLIRTEPKDTLLATEKATFDLWAWTDKQLQPMQKLNAGKEKKRTYKAVYNTKNRTIIQLADTLLKSMSFAKDYKGEFAFGSDNSKYQRANSWDALWYKDYYKVELATGTKTKIIDRISYLSVAPEQNYGVYFNWKDSVYYGIDLKTNENFSLSEELSVPFYNELHDQPSNPSAYGIVGWSNKGKYVYIYDRYDIWKFDLTRKTQPLMVTRGKGRENKIVYRYKRLDKEEEYINIKETQLLSLFDETSKEAGFAQTEFSGGGKIKTLVKSSHKYSSPLKAKHLDRLLLTKQSCTEFPNLYTCDLNFKKLTSISDANPQQKEFNWCTSELVTWTSLQGEKLEGFLVLPENFDPNKSYPMVSYFYERNSEELNRYWMPSPSRSIISKSFYASNEYIVFVPDITYTTGNPGQNAYDAIVSGVLAMCDERSYIDKKRLALQGQSWGGYQTAYLVTRTNLFAAAMAGAPVSNMTSAYGGIRWGTGMSRMFQYEHTQSRIGGTLWEKPMQYIENSPVFYADKVETPLFIMHNDEDGAVPWYQGIEYFVALRRLNKPVWMVSYNKEPHNLKASSWGNRIDLSNRMFEFFNHYLKDAPAPEWMINGIPAIEKGKR